MEKGSQSTTNSSGKRLDLVLRIPEYVRIERGLKFSTIGAHSEVAREQGEVMFGKFGAALKGASLQRLEASKGAGSPRLIVVMKKGSFVGFSAVLGGITDKLPSPAEQRYVPEFYHLLAEMNETPSTWFRLMSPFEPIELSSFSLVTSGRPLLEVISETRTSMMLVHS